jgi:uncharacterized phage protein (TIGR01671 family)
VGDGGGMSNFSKYRVWDAQNNQMLEVATVNFLGSKGFSSHYCHFNLSIGLQTITGEDPEIENEEHFNSLVWLQPTGLQDKNEKDIFEGDLLRYAIQGDTQAELMEVKLPEFFIELGHDDQYYLPDKESFEVIGNVYEHSHLLKEEHGK